jgi:hypothetical protein
VSFDQTAYRALASLTARMADLAEANDNEGLSQLGVDYDRLTLTLKTSSAQTLDQIGEVEDEIRQIIDNQRRIAELTAPWLSHVKILLRENKQEQTLIDTYRASN